MRIVSSVFSNALYDKHTGGPCGPADKPRGRLHPSPSAAAQRYQEKFSPVTQHGAGGPPCTQTSPRAPCTATHAPGLVLPGVGGEDVHGS